LLDDTVSSSRDSAAADVVVGGRETRQAEGLQVAPVILEQAENVAGSVVARPDHLAVIWNPNIFILFLISRYKDQKLYTYYVYMLPAAVQDEKGHDHGRGHDKYQR
jgi:hypothetical protein